MELKEVMLNRLDLMSKNEHKIWDLSEYEQDALRWAYNELSRRVIKEQPEMDKRILNNIKVACELAILIGEKIDPKGILENVKLIKGD